MYNLRSTDEPSTERPEFPEPPRSRNVELEEEHHAGYWVAVFLLAIAIGGLCWYGYPTLKQVPSLLTQFPALQKSYETMSSKVSASESEIKTWASSHQELKSHVAELETSMSSRIDSARRQAQVLSDKVYQRVHGEVSEQAKATDEKLSRLQADSEARVAKLQTEVSGLREEAARQAEELRNVRNDMQRDGANRDEQLASLNAHTSRDSREIDGINKKLAVKRVDFEVSKNHSQQLTEELSLGITSTDVSHRRVNGWMWVMPDRRTIWLQKQAAQQPIIWYGRSDGKRREVVITNVDRGSVSGYVLLPADDGATVASAAKGD